MFTKTIIPFLIILSPSTVDGFLVLHQQHHPHTASRISQPSFSSLPSLAERPTRTCVSVSSSRKNTDSNGIENKKNKNQKGRGQNQKKKRRFAQEVDPIISIQAPNPKPRFHDYGDEFGTVSSTTGTNIDKRQQHHDNKNSRNNSKNPMLQNNKSIDELESIMSNRWGTGLEKWTANFDEWEVVYDEDGDSDKSKGNPNQNVSFKSGRKVRSKPVLNPWDKEEKQRLYNEKEKKKLQRKNKKNNDFGMQTNASVFQSAKDRQDAVLDRVRRNQERLNVKKDQNQGQGNNNVQNSGYSRGLDIDFYDEDDEGYEAPQSSLQIYSGDDDDDEELENEAMNFYDSIIAPKPVGGSGSSSRQQSEAKPADSDNGRGGFFFNEAAAVTTMTTDNSNQGQQSPKQSKQKKDLKKIVREPMLDNEGRKMYLTLEQATRTFDAASNESDSEGALRDDDLSWEDIGITNQSLQRNLNSMDCFTPLPVQDKACPSIVSGNDVLVSTHTGSGKTLAFLVPLAQRLLFDSESEDGDQKLGVKVIIVAPGRELASQIVAVARDLFKGTELTAMLAIGGTPFSRNFEQIRKKKPTFLIGTPGRIAELVVGKPGDKSGKLKIASLQTIVLDECDALLEYEPHREPTEATMDVLKRRHRDSLQSILCSATAGDLMASAKLDGYLRETFAHAQSDKNDASITAASNGESSRTRVSRTAIHGVVHVQHKRFALDMLRKILYTEPAPQQVLVFVDNARRVGIVVDKLAEMGIIAAPLHGGQGSEKGERAEVNKALREGFVGIVVATEMAARGIDAPYLTHVINLDLPTDASHYAHRAGRCGRGGRPGVVVNVAVGKREQGVPLKFANALDIDMYETEPQAGKLIILRPTKEKR